MKLGMKMFVLLSAILSILPSLLSQTATTALRGDITDHTGARVAGATITLTEAASGVRSTTKSNGKGEYVFSPLAPGRYSIAVSAHGFAEQTKQAELLVDQPANINFTLNVHGTSIDIDVSAEVQTLNVTDATLGNAVNNNTVEALPMEGRNVPDLLSVQPGVLYLGRGINQNSDSRSGAVSGARSDQSNVTLDGLDDNDQTNGFAFTGVLRTTLDSTQEFRVTTTNSNADAGRSSGAQVSLVTKSGTNQWHGGLYEYNRNTIATANNWFNKQAEIIEGLPNAPGKLIRNTFGGTVGGPIRKDRLFFFFNYEGQRTAENQQVTQIVPTSAYRSGVLQYLYDSGANQTSAATLSAKQVAQLDQPCVQNQVCPWGAGPNPNILTYFSQFPLNNGFTKGDGLNLGSYSFSSPAPGSLNTSILKLDYLLNDRNRFFVRGNLQKDMQSALRISPDSRQPPNWKTIPKDWRRDIPGPFCLLS